MPDGTDAATTDESEQSEYDQSEYSESETDQSEYSESETDQSEYSESEGSEGWYDDDALAIVIYQDADDGAFTWVTCAGDIFLFPSAWSETFVEQRTITPDGTWEEWVRGAQTAGFGQGLASAGGLPDNGLGTLRFVDGRILDWVQSAAVYDEPTALGRGLTLQYEDTQHADLVKWHEVKQEVIARNGVTLGDCARGGTGTSVEIQCGGTGGGWVLIGDGHSFAAVNFLSKSMDGEGHEEPKVGTLTFKRNRTTANEFVLSGDVPLHRAETAVGEALVHPGTTYPHRDGKRVTVHH